MNCDPFEMRTPFNRAETFDHGKQDGKEGIPCVWCTNYDPRCRTSHTSNVDIDWIEGNTLLIDIGNNNLSRPLSEEIINSFDITTPPNWDELVEEYREDKRLMSLGIEAFQFVVDQRKRRIQIVLNKLFNYMYFF